VIRIGAYPSCADFRQPFPPEPLISPADSLLLPRRLFLQPVGGIFGGGEGVGGGWLGGARDPARGDGRREGADRGEVPALRRHRHRAQQVRPQHHRRRAQGVRPRPVAAG